MACNRTSSRNFVCFSVSIHQQHHIPGPHHLDSSQGKWWRESETLQKNSRNDFSLNILDLIGIKCLTYFPFKLFYELFWWHFIQKSKIVRFLMTILLLLPEILKLAAHKLSLAKRFHLTSMAFWTWSQHFWVIKSHIKIWISSCLPMTAMSCSPQMEAWPFVLTQPPQL